MLLSLIVISQLAANGTIGGAHSPECDSTALIDGTTIEVCGKLSPQDRTVLDVATFLADDLGEWASWVDALTPMIASTDALGLCAAQAVQVCGAGKVCGISVIVNDDVAACSFTCGTPPCAGPIPPTLPTPPTPVPQAN